MVTVTVYGPPTLMFGMVQAPPPRVLAPYEVPLGSCLAMTLASVTGFPSTSVTKPPI
jgi:hypothetical protein